MSIKNWFSILWFGISFVHCAISVGSGPATGKSTGGLADCTFRNITLPIRANRTKLLLPTPKSQQEITQVLQNIDGVNGVQYQASLNGGTAEISTKYTIFTKLCTPPKSDRYPSVPNTVQFLTHGATLDHNYWDIAPTFSYVDAAAKNGYATLSYDRLGTGLSQHPDPIQEVQGPIQVETAHQLIALLRSGKLDGHKYTKVTGVGHSAGSVVTIGISSAHLEDFDAVILTGVSSSFAYSPISVAGQALEPAALQGRFRGLSYGYMTPAAVPQAVQYPFFLYPHYDQNIFDAQFKSIQTNTFGELLTLAAISAPNQLYKKPVYLINGAQDFVFCGGDCGVPANLTETSLKTFFPTTKYTGYYLQPNAGHSLAAHHSAQDGFSQMLHFLESNSIS